MNLISNKNNCAARLHLVAVPVLYRKHLYLEKINVLRFPFHPYCFLLSPFFRGGRGAGEEGGGHVKEMNGKTEFRSSRSLFLHLCPLSCFNLGLSRDRATLPAETEYEQNFELAVPNVL